MTSAGTTPIVECVGLTKHFGGVHAVDEVSFHFDEGSITGVIGPNGAGKSTLFALIAGFQRPSGGRLLYCGKDVTGWAPAHASRAGVARTFQLMRVFGSMSVLENVAIGCYQHTRRPSVADQAAWEILERLGLTGQANVKATALTAAWRKRLELARALATRPRIMLLDEVLSGLTPTETTDAIEMVRLLRSTGLTVVLVEHVMDVVMSLCDRVLVLDQGIQIAEGTPDEVSHDERVITAYLGADE